MGLKERLEWLKDLVLSHYGEKICSIVIFGSVARGDYSSLSDIDLLVVLKEVEGSQGKRLDEFFEVSKKLKDSKVYQEAREKGLPHRVQPVILSIDELREHPPLLLDLTTDALVLFDKDRIFQEEIEQVKRRLKELGARKVLVGRNRWYWILKPDLKRGETVTI